MIKAFDPSHLDLIDPLDWFLEDVNIRQNILDINGAPGCYLNSVFSLRGDCVAVIGGLANGRALNVWAYVSKSVEKYPILYHKALRDQINYWIEELRLIRVQSVVLRDNYRAINQHVSLGFVIEGVMRKSSYSGLDQVLLARVID